MTYITVPFFSIFKKLVLLFYHQLISKNISFQLRESLEESWCIWTDNCVMKIWRREKSVNIRKRKGRHVITENPSHFIADVETSIGIGLKYKMWIEISCLIYCLTNLTPQSIEVSVWNVSEVSIFGYFQQQSEKDGFFMCLLIWSDKCWKVTKSLRIIRLLQIDRQIKAKSKDGDHSRGWPAGSLFNSYYTKV